jgi:hypothetical protein
VVAPRLGSAIHLEQPAALEVLELAVRGVPVDAVELLVVRRGRGSWPAHLAPHASILRLLLDLHTVSSIEGRGPAVKRASHRNPFFMRPLNGRMMKPTGGSRGEVVPCHHALRSSPSS